MADLNINIADDKLARAKVALGKYRQLTDENGVAREATDQEVKQFMKQELGQMVRAIEHQEAVAAVTTSEF